MDDILKSIDDICPSGIYEIGYANISGLLTGNYAKYSYGLSLARKLDDKIIDNIVRGPDIDYYNLYHKINNELNNKSIAIANILNGNGINAVPIKATVHDGELDEEYKKTLRYSFSHKMIATRAGIGWIGKTDLLVTKKFGPRIRLASVLMTKSIMKSGVPINSSQCGKCNICVEKCPAQAANGISWEIGIDRDSFYNPFKCRKYCRKVSYENIQKEISLCGLCIAICPKGQK